MSEAATTSPPATFQPASLTFHEDSRPIRSEVLGPEHLEEQARGLAQVLQPVRVTPGRPFLRAFSRNARRLRAAHQAIVAGVRNHEPFGSDAEWLLDNFHIIAEALAEIQTDMPSGYYH